MRHHCGAAALGDLAREARDLRGDARDLGDHDHGRPGAQPVDVLGLAVGGERLAREVRKGVGHPCNLGRGAVHHGAGLHDEADVARDGDVLARIARHRDEVGEVARRDPAEVVLAANQRGAVDRRGAQRVHRRQPARHDRGEFLRSFAVGDCGGVGAAADPYAGRGGAGEHGAGEREHLLGFRDQLGCGAREVHLVGEAMTPYDTFSITLRKMRDMSCM